MSKKTQIKKENNNLPAQNNAEKSIEQIIKDLSSIKQLKSDSDINKMSHILLEIVNTCIPIAFDFYKNFPKDSASKSLNTFISQAREIGNDIRALQDKRKNVSKIMNELLKPVFQQIYEEMLFIPTHLEEAENQEDYEKRIQDFLTYLLKNIQVKLEDIF